ncbi:MAG: hypothetical protein LBD15_04000 [Holosporales bacterium]|nr:hypothetical protein [Holosporales bacterium]
MKQTQKKSLLIAATLFLILPKGEGMEPLEIIPPEEEVPLNVAIKEPRRLGPILLHFVKNDVDVSRIVSQPGFATKPLHVVLCLNGKDPIIFIQRMLRSFVKNTKSEHPSCFLFKEENYPLDTGQGEVVLTTKLELRGVFANEGNSRNSTIGSSSFHLFSFGRKVAEIRNGKLYKFSEEGTKTILRDFSMNRDISFEIHLQCYIDSNKETIRTGVTLFSTLDEEFQAEAPHLSKGGNSVLAS